MNKTLLVLKTEFINTFTRRSFLLTLILVPLIPALILGGISLFGRDDASASNLFGPSNDTQKAEGYVDQANLISELPSWIEPGRLIEYKNEKDARDATRSGEIIGYYFIEPNYIKDGAIRYVRQDFNPLTAMDSSWVIKSVIEFNLLGDDPHLYEAYQSPAWINPVDITPEETQRDNSSALAFYLPYGVTMLFYVLIITSASLMLNSVAKEKENRVMEILMSSIKPVQLLAGKILGLGLVGLIQMIFWVGSALLLLGISGTTLNIPPSLQLPPQILLWGIVFFVLGYLIYATIMAGVGALVPNVKEASQATFYVILPILVPLLMIGVIIEQPNATLPVILSLIPFTAPNTIMTRLAVGPVPLWQLMTSIALMILTIFLLIRAVSGMFRAKLLLTGKKFSIGLFLKALMGKELTSLELSEG